MKLRTFKCDLPKCKKQISIDENSGYPYKKGWVYIYNLEIKVGKNAKVIDSDKHYCCYEHMLEHIKKGVEYNLQLNKKPINKNGKKKKTKK